MDYTQSSLFGKTCPEPSHQIMGTTFKPCSGKSQRPIFQCLELADGQKPEWSEVKEWVLHGECLTPSIGGSPNTVKESFLSQVLESGGGGIQVLFESESVHRDSPQGESAAEGTSTGSVLSTVETGGVLSEHGTAFIGNGQADQLYMKKVAGALNCMHEPQSVIMKNWGVAMKQDNTIYIDRSLVCAGFNSNITGNIRYGKTDTLLSCMYKGMGGVLVKGEKDVRLYESHAQDSRYNEKSLSPTLSKMMGTGAGNVPLVESEYVVRRLTPLECERLQGLPDGYTDYGSDTSRYKALGNGMAQPCADFIISKVVEAFEKADS